MVCVPSTFVTVVLACLATTHAAPLKDNAYMNVPNVIPLNAENPAFGGRPSTNMATVIAPREIILSRADVEAGLTLASNSSNTTTTRRRYLEVASSPDLDKLEAYFGSGSIERNFQALKAYSSKKIQPSPWPSSYWPVYEDSINAKWDGPSSQPASEKYARAFGLNVQSFMNTISSHNGIDSNNGARTCTDSSQCSSLNDGSKCAIRAGKTSGYCTPTWWGICHAWSPAAILEAEPSCEVVLNGISFKPLDIKALVSLFYDGAALGTVFMGARENGKDDSRDEYGRFNNAARRDVGPGFFHIAVSNIMGKFGRSFVADIDPGYKVWNQPIRAFNVVSTERMTTDQAAQRFFNVAKYPFNGNARSIAYVEMDFTWINELVEDGPLVANGRVDATTETRRHKYVLELDSQDNVLGGEWVAESQTNHPDFMWFATEKPSPRATTDVGLTYENIKKLLEASAIGQCPTTAPSGGRCGSEANGALTCPSGEYCQPWNPSEYYCRKLDAKCGKQEAGMDYWGNDLESVSGLLLPEQCCDKCHATEGCTSYTFINYVTWGDKKPLCFLKSGTPSDKRANPKAVSAMIERTSCSNKLWDRCGSGSAGAKCCEAGSYCQPWDLLNYQCMPLPKKCGTLVTAVDFYGSDISVSYGLSTDECCDKCAATTGCKAFTYVNDNTAGSGKPACYLKSGSGDRRSNPHVVSGLVN